MDGPALEQIIESEREWRRYVVNHVEEMRKELHALKTWNLVFRLAGGGLLSLFYIYIESKLK